jgi:hypothetical protein
MAGRMQEGADLWRLHDFLTRRRREIDEKYDYRHFQLSMVFARLIHEGWLSLEELQGLAEDKLAKIEQVWHSPESNLILMGSELWDLMVSSSS